MKIKPIFRIENQMGWKVEDFKQYPFSFILCVCACICLYNDNEKSLSVLYIQDSVQQAA